MTISKECAEKGRRMMLLHSQATEIYRTIAEAPLVLPEVGISLIKRNISLANEGVEALHRIEPIIDEKTYHDFKTRLQDIESRLPKDISITESVPRFDELLKKSRWEADRLMNKVEDVMFQKVVACECGKKQ